MKRKKATATFEPVDDSIMENDEKITRELLEWFKESAVIIPQVKETKDASVGDT